MRKTNPIHRNTEKKFKRSESNIYELINYDLKRLKQLEIEIT